MDVPPDAEQLAELRHHFSRLDAKINKLRAEQKERERTIARLLDECCSCPHDDDDSDDVETSEEPEPVSFEQAPPDLPDLDSMWLHFWTLNQQLNELRREKTSSEARMEKVLARRCCCCCCQKRAEGRCVDVFLEKEKKESAQKVVSEKEEVLLRKRRFEECMRLYERMTVRCVRLERRLQTTPFRYGDRYPPRIMARVSENFTARHLKTQLKSWKRANRLLYYDELMYGISETIDSVKKRVGRAKERLREKLTIKR